MSSRHLWIKALQAVFVARWMAAPFSLPRVLETAVVSVVVKPL